MIRTDLPPRTPAAAMALAAAALLGLSACATTGTANEPRPARTPVAATAPGATPATPGATPYPSTYVAPASAPTLIRGATVLTGTGTRLDDADVLLAGGRVEAVGRNLQAPADARIIDGRGRWVTPGLIDVHSHLGVYPSPEVSAHEDGNEATNPSTAQVWAEHSVWPQDPGFEAALEGGVTTLQVLPGSANLIGGRTVTLKNVPAVTYQAMKFPGAPHGLKMACGENPKRVYGSRRQPPATRMGNVAGWRAQWIEAQEYGRRAGNANAQRTMRRDLRLETLAAVLRGEILVHHHCYRADEMAIVLDLAREFGYRVTAFHHAVEAYKISNLLAEHGTCSAMWADWWAFKMESYDGIPENIALVDAAPGGCAIVHSDSPEGIQRLNQEAAKAMTSARRMGVEIAPEHAIRWITSNAARALGVGERTGTLEPGRMGDVVVWNGNPFSARVLAEQVFIDGALRFDRSAPRPKPESDLLLGQPAIAQVQP